jgi:hypothetical protein
LLLTGKAEAVYTQTFTDYPHNTYPSFEMIASLLHQKFGAQYQAADIGCVPYVCCWSWPGWLFGEGSPAESS